ncbi:MAG: FAD-dependent oxidoreductase [Actinomycetota bacterium]
MEERGQRKRFVIIGGGPGGTTCATHAARMGAEVTMIERDIVGGAAHLLDCIPSKAMIATGGAMSLMKDAEKMGLANVDVKLDFEALRTRIADIEKQLTASTTDLLASQGVRMIQGTGRLLSANQVEATAADGTVSVLDADVVVLATGSRPRIPDWANIDGTQVLTTRHAYPPPELPEHLIVVGSGVTGVEFVHMFNSFGSEVSLIVSRRQVLPGKDPEVAAVLEQSFIDRGVDLFFGARATGIEAGDGGVSVHCNDGRIVSGSHVLLAIGSIPNSENLGLEAAGVETEWGYVKVDHNCKSSVPHIYAAGDLSGRLPLSSVAATQGRKIAEHAMGRHVGPHHHIDYDKAASAIFTDPEIADVGVAEADAFAEGRKIRVTKVPFSMSPKALINNDSRGFVKIVSDPATGVVIGGSIVGRHAAELISVVALAVSAGLTVTDLVETLFVHPALAGVLGEAAI